MSNHNIVAIDFETALIRPGKLAPPPVCLTWFDSRMHEIDISANIFQTHLFPKHAASSLHALLADGWGGDWIVGANIAFDLAVAASAWPSLLPLIFEAFDQERIFDVQHNERLIDIARGELDGKWVSDPAAKDGKRFVKYQYSLADVAVRYGLRDRHALKDDVNAWRLRYWELKDLPIAEWPADAVSYACDDAIETWRVFDRQLKQHSDLLSDAGRQAQYAFALHLISCRGLRTDATAIAALKEAKQGEFEQVRDLLTSFKFIRGPTYVDKKGKTRATPAKKIGTRDKKLAQARMVEVCEAAQIEITKTATGQVSLDADACDRVKHLDEGFAVYARYLTLENIVKSQIPSLLKGTRTCIQPRFNVLRETGRTSCSSPKVKAGQKPMQFGFQVQNVRREPGIRECFTAREGYYYADADYTGLELCTMAQACVDLLGGSTLGEALNRGIDVHLDFAAALLGITYDEAVRRKHEKVVKDARQLSKIANFGYPGGLGAQGFVAFAHGYGRTLTAEEAKALKDAWLRKWPEFSEYFRYVRERLDPETNRIPLLEQIRSQRFRGKVKFTEACNTYFQGLGADVAKHALYEVTKACYAQVDSPLFGSYPVNFVHDQIIAEVPIAQAHDAAIELGRVMTATANEFWLPDVPVRCEPCLSVHWSKDAVAVYGADGLLVPWDLAKATKAEVIYADGQTVSW